MAVEKLRFCHDVVHLSSFSFAKSVWHGRGALVLTNSCFKKVYILGSSLPKPTTFLCFCSDLRDPTKQDDKTSGQEMLINYPHYSIEDFPCSSRYEHSTS